MTPVTVLKTEFASAKRSTRDEVDQGAKVILSQTNLEKHFDAIPSLVLVLDENRQIVFVNQATVSTFNLPNRSALYGLRPGEALDCVRLAEGHNGCGTTSFCSQCGAVRAILSGLSGKNALEECQITDKTGQNIYDLRVATTSYAIEDKTFAVFVADDIQHEKRRQVLERTFFHDVSNTLAILMGSLNIISNRLPQGEAPLLASLHRSVNMLVSEITAQRELLQAEDGELQVECKELFSISLLNNIAALYNSSENPGPPQVIVSEKSEQFIFSSDETKALRVVGNMVKNALEASTPSQKVELGCFKKGDDRLCIWVQNEEPIPPKVQLQIFNRSFSTKGAGRGIGTYSMKLLAERYLKGKVSFISCPQQGTTFQLELPLRLIV